MPGISKSTVARRHAVYGQTNSICTVLVYIHGHRIDTLKAARDLEAAGLNPKRAEAIVIAVRAAQGDLVTTPVLKAELSALETRLTLRMLAIVSAGIAVLAAIERFSG